MSSRKRRLWIIAGLTVWLTGIAVIIGLAFAFPSFAQEAAAAVFTLITTGVIGAATWMLKQGLPKDDDGSD